MIHQIFTIHDAKAAAYLPPFILPNAEMAKRIFTDCVNSEDHQFAKHPEDYTLFRLGTFDDNSAQYMLTEGIHSEGNGLEFITHELQPFMPDDKNDDQTLANRNTVSNDPPILPGTARGNST